ncbi:hypothetical protein, variant 1 [Aphanomyces astaci]|uniref:Importin subunit alpha n=1 Tax=Aphanomyces astaci TaxID=112090 RepID=W4GAM2_APHAT|nr:hypothetical protein, variant 1 [Aphanomyces astaci]ETV76715.1 hypothetical protein, variant 1 [Aphanomyces astaci]|eukprot:XP_009833626.1 hypothetical protein, variant 1 [Aphanomyces astaci]
MSNHESVKAKSQLKKSTRARTAHTDFVRKSKQVTLNKRRRLPSQDMDSDMDDVEFQQLVQALLASPEHTLPILEKLKAGLSVCSAARLDNVAESGVIPILIDLLERPSSTTMELTQVLWCLTFITSGLYEHTKAVLPAVPTLLTFLQNADLSEHAAWTLGNIAADCEEFRLHLIRHGAIAPLVEHLHHPQPAMLKVSLWALSNMARGVQTSAKAFFDHDIGSILLALLHANDTPDVVQELLWLLSFLTAKEDKYLRWLLDHDLWTGLLHHLDSKDPAILTPLLRVTGNLCCVTPEAAAWQPPYIHTIASELRFLYMLKRLLWLDNDSHVVAEAAWAVSNLAARDAGVVASLVQHDFIPRLAMCFRDGGYDIRKEAAFALTNIAVTSPSYAEQIVALNVLDGFVHLLSVPDLHVVGTALQFLENVLRHVPRGVYLVESADGIAALETVQDGHSDLLATKAEQLVNEFYGESYDAPFSPPSDPPQASFAPIDDVHPPTAGGRGRGAHMTRPAWATQ